MTREELIVGIRSAVADRLKALDDETLAGEFAAAENGYEIRIPFVATLGDDVVESRAN